MTVEEKMSKYLTKYGMSDIQSKLVMIEVKKDLESTFNNWDSEVDAYTTNLIFVLRENVKKTAFDWITKNKPEAWFKDVFKN